MRKAKRGPPLFELLGDDDGPGVVTIQPSREVKPVRPAAEDVVPEREPAKEHAETVSEPETPEPAAQGRGSQLVYRWGGGTRRFQ